MITFLCILISNIVSAQKPAETIPNFTFFKLDNTPYTDKDLPNGREIFFVFFDVTCDHCQQTIKILSAHINEFQGISIYLVTLDSKTKLSSFFNEFGKNLPAQKNVLILQDLRNMFIRQFGPSKYPSVFLYSSSKKLILYSDEDQYLEKFLKLINGNDN
jgi:peroxiredoxin